MIIKVHEPYECEVIVGYEDDGDTPIIEDEILVPEEEYDVDLLSRCENHINIQFGSGVCVFGLPTEAYQIVEYDNDWDDEVFQI